MWTCEWWIDEGLQVFDLDVVATDFDPAMEVASIYFDAPTDPGRPAWAVIFRGVSAIHQASLDLGADYGDEVTLDADINGDRYRLSGTRTEIRLTASEAFVKRAGDQNVDVVQPLIAES